MLGGGITAMDALPDDKYRGGGRLADRGAESQTAMRSEVCAERLNAASSGKPL